MSMKKLFTMIFALCISLGAWAQAVVSTDNGTTVITSTSTDVWINYGTAWQTLVENTKFKGDFSSFNWEDLAGKSYTRSLTDARFDYSEATGVQVSSINTLLTFNSLNSNISKLVLPANISIPTDISSLGVSDAIFKYVFVTNSSGVSSVYVTSKVTDASMLSYEFTASRIESITNNGINLTGDPDAMQVIHDYLVANNVPEEKITIPFVFRGNLDVTGGSVAQNISDAKAAHPEITDDAITSITVTSGTLSSDDLTRLGQLTNLETIILPNGTASFPDLSSLTNFKKVVYKDAKGNYNVLIPKRGSSLDVSVIGDYDVTGTNVTITGELNATDLASINGIANASLLNLSDITIASGSSITSLVANGNAAIVLPNSITNAELGTLQHVGGDNPTYKCLAYLEDAAYQSSGNDHKVCVYTTQCSSLTNLSSFINTNSSLVFLPLYKTDGTLDNYMLQYNNEIANLLTYVKDLPALNIDFGMVYAGVSTDFSQLNPATHYITIPVTSTDYDFTDEVNPYNAQTGEKYIYGDNIYVVATYKNPEGIYAKSCSYAGKPFTATEPTNITYVRRAGTLAGASGTVSQEMLTATRQIFVGTLDDSDVSAMAMMHATTFDFLDATISAENMKAFHNGYVHYLILPDNEESAIAATSADVCNYRNVNDEESSKCPELLSVGAYNTTTNTLTTWSSAPGNVYKVTTIIRPIPEDRYGNKNRAYGLENLQMSGYLNSDDISIDASNTKSGLTSASVKDADLTYAVFPTQTDMVLSAWGGIETLQLPISSAMTIMPENCLYGTASLKSLCIPSNYETIGKNALKGCGATCIYTTAYEGDDFRDDVNVYNHGEFTITLSSNLKHIETGAFCTGNEKWTDVYSLAKDAPTCAADAFNSMNTYANNTYAGLAAHPVERANYKKADDKLMTVLHYPVTCSETEAKQYTDINRKYSLIDETGAYDGEGNLMRWPNQSEFMRSYNQAVAGLTWDTWSDARVPVGEPTANELFDSGHYGASYAYAGTTYVTEAETSNSYHISADPALKYWDGQVLKNYTPSFTIDNNNVYDYNNYMGWHQFVLCQSVSVDRIVPKTTTYVQGDWYTLCLPYDLTREQVLSLIGIPKKENVTVTYSAAKGYQAEDGSWFPQVYTLTGVTRQYPKITLTFSQELMKRLEKGKGDITFNDANSEEAGTSATYKSAYDYSEEVTNGQTAAGSNKIYLKGGFPYLVRPILPAGTTIDGTLGQYMLKVGSFNKTNLGHQATVTKGNGTANGTIAAPIVNQKFIARNGTEKIDFKVDEETTSKYYYYFVGTYTEEMIPAYAYHLSGGSWSRTEDESKTWQPFTAIIGGKCTDEGAVYETDNPNSDGTNGLTTYYVSLKNQDDNFVTAGQHNIQYLITFEDEEGEGEVVAIDKIDGRDINNAISAEGNVYNMTGQFVGNSLNGLAKGVYLVNGKKVLVK